MDAPQDAPGKTSHWLIEGLSGVNVLALIGALIAGAWYIFEVRAGQSYMSQRLLQIENEIEEIAERGTRIAELGWETTQLRGEYTRLSAQIERLQDQNRDIMSTMRDIERGLESDRK